MRSLESILTEYLQLVEAGKSPQSEEYLRLYPEHATELSEFFRNHDWLEFSTVGTSKLTSTRLGVYRLEKEIARGGMGVVYRATQSGLERPVALKVINGGVLASREARRRFQIEAKAAAKLSHPNIVPIHEIGEWEGQAYYSMTLIEGETLQAAVDKPSSDYRMLAGLVRELAEAVEYAHQCGIVHRDLKPANVLVDAQGRPWLTDFGLAKWHQKGTLLTQTGQIMGTPAYMSPQQAQGKKDSGPSCDVYSLGAILYALLTGAPPYSGDTPAEVLTQVLHNDPVPVRDQCREIPIELAHITMHCLEREPVHRYLGAAQLAEDLQSYLDGESLQISSRGWLKGFRRLLRRDQYRAHFQNWGRGLFLIGCIIFMAHLSMFALASNPSTRWLAFWVPRMLMFVGIVIVFYIYRGGKIMPRNVAERPVWSIWIGYLFTLAVMNFLLWINGIPSQAIFAVAASLSGFGFLAMSGHLWGVCVLIGILFHVCAILATCFPRAAPLVVGSAWFVAMAVLAKRYQSEQPAQTGSLDFRSTLKEVADDETIG